MSLVNTEYSGQSGEGRQQGRIFPEWYIALSNYRDSNAFKASWQLCNSLVPYFCCLLLMVLFVRRGYPYALTLLVAILAAAFLVRLFILFHDCVHGSLFTSKGANTFFGYLLGILVFTPFEDWRYSHLRHHASYANLDARGFGDIWTLTQTEYANASKLTKFCYRFYRSPVGLIGLGALFGFLLRYRLPSRKSTRKERMSVVLTNLLIAGCVLVVIRWLGWRTYLLVQLPVLWIAGAVGVWLFYVQHQFEGVYWSRKGEWDVIRASMEGSSFYQLPSVLRWFSANIGYHHVHHLRPRIPNYRLKECYDAIPALQGKAPLTLKKSLSAIKLKLWDEEHKNLVGFPQTVRFR
jgi:acyl-lipid omega-6 desaturase (Delta-12 desaturase)